MSDRDSVKVAGQELLSRIAEVMDKVEWASFLALADMLPRARRTFVTGAGRSGLVARSFGMRLMHAGLPAFVPGETITPAAGPGDLLVAISCTGQTGITEYIARRAGPGGQGRRADSRAGFHPRRPGRQGRDDTSQHARHRAAGGGLRARRKPLPGRGIQRPVRPAETRPRRIPQTPREFGVT